MNMGMIQEAIYQLRCIVSPRPQSTCVRSREMAQVTCYNHSAALWLSKGRCAEPTLRLTDKALTQQLKYL